MQLKHTAMMNQFKILNDNNCGLKCVQLPVGFTLKIDISNRNSDPSVYAYIHSAFNTIDFLKDVDSRLPHTEILSWKNANQIANRVISFVTDELP